MDLMQVLKELQSDPEAAEQAKAFKERMEGCEGGDADHLESIVDALLKGKEPEEEDEEEPDDLQAKDFNLGQLSTKDLSAFRSYPAHKQNEIVRLLEKVGYWRDRDSAKSKKYQADLDKLTGDTKIATDPPVSEKQRRAMYAAREGKSTLGIPKKVGEEFVGKARDMSYHAVAGAKAKEEGKSEKDNPYPKGSEPARQWADGYKGTTHEPYGKDEEVKGHAAGILYVAPDGDVLLLRRGSGEENYAGHWALPGGKAEEGESPEQAADREAGEEMGAAPEGTKKLLDRVVTPNKMMFHTFAQPTSHKFTPKLNNEHSGYAWAPLHQLPQPMHPAVAKTLQSRLGQTKPTEDMTPEDWDGLKSGMLKWLEEEEQEDEHAEDASPKSEAWNKALMEWLKAKDTWAKAKRAWGNGRSSPQKFKEADEEFKKAKRAHAEATAAYVAKDCEQALDAKLTQQEVSYGPGKGKTRCKACEYFEKDALACQLVDGPIEPTGWCKLFAAEPQFKVEVVRDFDGPWVSCMSKDGLRMYVNRNLPREVKIHDKQVDLDEDLLHHKVPEWEEIQELLAEFEMEHERKPKLDERKQLYLQAHHSAGTPSERAYCKEQGIDWDALSAWFRGEEARIEKLKIKKPAPDADVKPTPHHHSDLEITMDEGFSEEDHPRKDDGKFGSGGGSSSHSDKDDAGSSEEGKSGEGEQTGEGGGKVSDSHAAKVKAFLKQPGSTKIIGKAAGSWLKENGLGALSEHLHGELIIPAIQASVGLALEHLGASIPESVAVSIAGYAVHKIMTKMGYGPENTHKLVLAAGKALLAGYKKLDAPIQKGLELRRQHMGDAAPDADEVKASLERFVKILEKTSTKDLMKAASPLKEDGPKAKDAALALDEAVVYDKA